MQGTQARQGDSESHLIAADGVLERPQTACLWRAPRQIHRDKGLKAMATVNASVSIQEIVSMKRNDQSNLTHLM